ncbi:MFS transporter [Actinomyces urogenitalis]|uniref:MFS transporter n=1 Tax=Actinomyces urogenitalis TaxID=103621 RepID=UPI0028FE06F8|nr:MFS transporter [Actinomyces urogenitalis]MDU0864299.1 MFS transporter [Actinomyces urogenitalis]MDU0874907.1 MFS transporter [Actinomyces urogenitalis]MDU1564241.1 MFS transporter [Actinomyces urogenitalis]MDU1639943.1 MFS transporter [Actinomyces urogenitalis]MDU5427215.1 MFS transporter [Actinomyces urogenitalis]
MSPTEQETARRREREAARRAERQAEKAERAAARAERKAERIRREQRRLAFMRRRRRLRADDVTVVEESALRKAILGSVVGNIMEWYDVGVYAYVAVLVGQAFLPAASDTTQNLFSLGVFAVTFIARPLGGVILGQLGDRLGRKEVLAFTLMMMAIATFGIGILPPASVLGIWAPILLICLKLVQGFSTGGEYAGATTFVTEYAPDKKRGFYASLLDWGSYMGNALGAGLVTVLMLTLPDDVMATWGWRIPFMLALPMGAIALYLRSRIEDTPAFRGAQAEDDEEEPADLAAVESDIMKPEGPLGLRDMVRTYWRELATAIVLVAGANTVGYALTSYMPTYLTTTLGYDEVHGPLLTLPVLVLVAFLVPVIGYWSDHVGRKPVLFSAAVSAVVLVVPAFMLMEHGQMWSTLLGLLLLAYPVAAYVGNLAASLPAIFPTSSRYGGMGISYNFAVAVFGGTAAFIMEALVTATGSALAPAFWIMATSLAAFAALFALPETARRPLPGSMPAVATEEEVAELVETQEENPDLDVAELFAQAPVHLVDQQPTVAEAQAEVEVALAAEAEAREAVKRAVVATAAARAAVVQAKEAEAQAEADADAGAEADEPKPVEESAAAGEDLAEA